MQCFDLLREDFEGFEGSYDVNEALPEQITVFEDGEAYENPSTDAYPWNKHFFDPEVESFEECAKRFRVQIEDYKE